MLSFKTMIYQFEFPIWKSSKIFVFLKTASNCILDYIFNQNCNTVRRSCNNLTGVRHQVVKDQNNIHFLSNFKLPKASINKKTAPSSNKMVVSMIVQPIQDYKMFDFFRITLINSDSSSVSSYVCMPIAMKGLEISSLSFWNASNMCEKGKLLIRVC